MGAAGMKPPKVFISYAWTTPKHQDWVTDLAIRLREVNGIDIVYDKWDLKRGHDTYAFMESMVTSPDVDKVLIICDKGYKKKADNREGGVGTETLLITPELYGNVVQEKFIPIVAERDDTGQTFMPAYLAGRMYIDFSNDETFEENYEMLLRDLVNAPKYKKPAIGALPAYLFEEEVSHYKTSSIIKRIGHALENNPKRVPALLNSFTEAFLQEIEQLKIESFDPMTSLDEAVINKIEQSIPLRDEYLKVLKLLIDDQVTNIDWLVDFFGKLYDQTKFRGSGQYYVNQFDQFKYLLHELCIYTCGMLTKSEDFKSLGYLLHTDYYVSSGNRSEVDFTKFYSHLDTFERRKIALRSNKYSLHADMLIEKVNYNYLTKEEFIDADETLFMITKINKGQYYMWFPLTYVYKEREDNVRHSVFNKLKSARYAMKVAPLFMTGSIAELKKKLETATILNESTQGYPGSFAELPKLRDFILVENIGIKP